jgi:hypothetical protein
MITVKPMGQRYAIEIAHGEEKLLFIFSQLDYFSRNEISILTTSYEGGKLSMNVGLAVFYNLKYALKEVRGFSDSEGKPYKLEFEQGREVLTDKCINELLATPIQNELILAARDLGSNVPDEILDPITNKKIEGIEVIDPQNLKARLEKK